MAARGTKIGWRAALRRTRPGGALVGRLGARGQHDTARSPVLAPPKSRFPGIRASRREGSIRRDGVWAARCDASGKTLALEARWRAVSRAHSARLRDSLRVLVAFTLCLTQCERKISLRQQLRAHTVREHCSARRHQRASVRTCPLHREHDARHRRAHHNGRYLPARRAALAPRVRDAHSPRRPVPTPSRTRARRRFLCPC